MCSRWPSPPTESMPELRARLERAGLPLGGNDLMIAAQALASGSDTRHRQLRLRAHSRVVLREPKPTTPKAVSAPGVPQRAPPCPLGGAEAQFGSDYDAGKQVRLGMRADLSCGRTLPIPHEIRDDVGVEQVAHLGC